MGSKLRDSELDSLGIEVFVAMSEEQAKEEGRFVFHKFCAGVQGERLQRRLSWRVDEKGFEILLQISTYSAT